MLERELLIVRRIALSPDGKSMVAETDGVCRPGGLTFALTKTEPDNLLATNDRVTVKYSSPTSGQIVAVDRNTNRFDPNHPKWEQIWPKNT